jgi:hypothetical protein
MKIHGFNLSIMLAVAGTSIALFGLRHITGFDRYHGRDWCGKSAKSSR